MSLEIEDLVQIDDVPGGLDAETAQVFYSCVGRVFRVAGFERGLVELEVGEVFGEPSYLRSIWIEPQLLSRCADQV